MPSFPCGERKRKSQTIKSLHRNFTSYNKEFLWKEYLKKPIGLGDLTHQCLRMPSPESGIETKFTSCFINFLNPVRGVDQLHQAKILSECYDNVLLMLGQ